MGRMTVMKEAAKWDMSSVRVQSRRFLSRHRRGCRAGAALRGRARQRLRGISIGHVVTEQGCSQVRHVGVRTTMGRVAAQAPRPTWTSIGRRGSLGARATSACGRQWAAWRRRRRVPRGPAWGGVSRGRARHVGVRTTMGRVAAAQARPVPRGPALGRHWAAWLAGRARHVGVRTDSGPRGGGASSPHPTWTSIGRRGSLGERATPACGRQWAAWRRHSRAASHVDQHWAAWLAGRARHAGVRTDSGPRGDGASAASCGRARQPAWHRFSGRCRI